MSPVRLLFVDDEPAIRQTLPAILRHHGFSVAVAATVPEALGQIAAQPFDVLIADLHIGEVGDGFTVVSAMRRTQPRCLNFILTGYPAFENALRAIQAQVDDYFVKPTNIETLVGKIRERLNGTPRVHELVKKTVAGLLREKGDEIGTRVLAAMKGSSELERLPLSDEERTDSLPKFLGELADMLDAVADNSLPTRTSAATEHGMVRRQQGYSVPMLIEEGLLIQQAIFAVVQEHIMELDLSRLIRDLSLVAESFSQQLLASSRALISAEADAA